MADALLQKLAAEVGKYPVTLAVQLPNRIKDGIELFPCRHEALVVHLFGIHCLQAQQAAYPHHEEFIQVAGEYLHELQPFAQRHAAVLRLLQHTLVKFQPGQLPVLGVAGHKLLAVLCTWFNLSHVIPLLSPDCLPRFPFRLRPELPQQPEPPPRPAQCPQPDYPFHRLLPIRPDRYAPSSAHNCT